MFWIFVALIAAVMALFAASNRDTVGLAFWPLPFVLDLPLYLAILAPLLIGFIAGAMGAWFGGRRGRRESRRRGRRIAALERELAAARAELLGRSENAPARLAARG